mgnify:CR=1 FL=1
MSNTNRNTKLFPISLLIIFILVFISSTMLAEEDGIGEIQGKLDDISEEEIRILESLFIQAQEIEELEREKQRITEDIDIMKEGTQSLEELIHKETTDYKNKLELLEQILKSYQRMGPSTYIEIILDSDSITNFLRRVNTLRDLTKNTGELLESIDKSKERLSVEKSKLDEKLESMKQKEEELQKNLSKKLELAKEMEEYLSSLEGDRAHYQERLDNIVEMMNRIGIMISDITEEFTHIIEEGNLPEDGVKLRFASGGVRGTIDEEVFNSIIQSNSNLPEIILHFNSNNVEMEMPQANLVLIGDFFVIDGHTIKFQVEEGRLYTILLTKETIEDFFKGGYFTFNLEPLIGRNTLESVETKKGYIELIVKINLF